LLIRRGLDDRPGISWNSLPAADLRTFEEGQGRDR
jgi:hypothetical protein